MFYLTYNFAFSVADVYYASTVNGRLSVSK